MLGIEGAGSDGAGEQPHGVVLAASPNELGDQVVDRRRHLDRLGTQRQHGTGAVVLDMAGDKADDPAARLGEQQDQQTGDPVAEVCAGVVQELVMDPNAAGPDTSREHRFRSCRRERTGALEQDSRSTNNAATGM